MMRLTMYLNLLDGTQLGWSGNSLALYSRTLLTAQAPTPGVDEVILWPSEDDDPMGGPMWTVRRRYLDAYGGWHADLTSMVIDPHDAAAETIRTYTTRNPQPYRPWYPATSGDPRPKLYDAGWRIYRGPA